MRFLGCGPAHHGRDHRANSVEAIGPPDGRADSSQSPSPRVRTACGPERRCRFSREQLDPAILQALKLPFAAGRVKQPAKKIAASRRANNRRTTRGKRPASEQRWSGEKSFPGQARKSCPSPHHPVCSGIPNRPQTSLIVGGGKRSTGWVLNRCYSDHSARIAAGERPASRSARGPRARHRAWPAAGLAHRGPADNGRSPAASSPALVRSSELPGGRREQIGTAHDLADLHGVIVADHGQLIGGITVLAQTRKSPKSTPATRSTRP